MATSNLERVGRAFDTLDRALRPWISRTRNDGASLPDGLDALLDDLLTRWDADAGRILGSSARRVVDDLRDVHKRHREAGRFDVDETYRALDDVARLLALISARDEAAELERMRQETLRARFDEEQRKESRRAASVRLEGMPQEGLRPWREVVDPHPDVARGTYQVAEFAADLYEVHAGRASDEYRDPVEFFRRTYLTEGLRQLLVGALRRLGGSGGDPVIELQTNFGGGKTHSMLALYHLFSGVTPTRLAGVEDVLRDADVPPAKDVKRVVIVGNKLSPGQPERKPDGTEVRTMWGEIAWQLGGSDGYAMVAAADATGTNPGDALRQLFARYAPCLVLIDEWVAYARGLRSEPGLPGGTFETHFTFAQQLSEAAKAAPRTLLVVSIPASESPQRKDTAPATHDLEVGGAVGAVALERIKNAIGRVESPWRPASPEESFEIVRRRLFQPVTDPSRYAARDAVVRAFAELYRSQPNEFPSECRERDYERRMTAAWPIHPELFDRLYDDWSTLPKFQRTRGVLRLMATVIHTLFHREDRTLMILPSSIPMDDASVQSELTRYLDDHWAPVIARDVDGPHSRPMAIDKENVNLGRVSATRRVARTLFVGSAPTQGLANKGIEDRSIKLGCVQPGEPLGAFSDALRRLTDQATYLYVDGPRHWYSTQPSVTRLAEDRAAQYIERDDPVVQHLVKRLQDHFKDARNRGDFPRVHVCPRTTDEVVDERDARLVVLDPDDPHTPNLEDRAIERAKTLLASHGTGHRRYRNALVFLAPDKRRLDELKAATRAYLAWESIVADRDALNLSPFQDRQARSKLEDAGKTVLLRIPETWCLLLVPEEEAQPSGPPALTWREFRLQGPDPLAVRASKRLRNEDRLLTVMAGNYLRTFLDGRYENGAPLWQGDHASLKTLADYFATYLYLPRLRSTEVLAEAVRNGVATTSWETDTFALADRFDTSAGRYAGLNAGRIVSAVTFEGEAVLVRSEVAKRQLDEDARGRSETSVTPPLVTGPSVPYTQGARVTPGAAPTAREASGTSPATALPRRFHAHVDVDALELEPRTRVLIDEVLRHLVGLPGAKVTVTLEIHAEIPKGAPESVVRTVSENCRTLRIEDPHFEDR